MKIVDANWYSRNHGLHRELNMGFVTNKIQRLARKYEGRIHHREDAEFIPLLYNTDMVGRLKRRKLFELVLSLSLHRLISVVLCSAQDKNGAVVCCAQTESTYVFINKAKRC